MTLHISEIGVRMAISEAAGPDGPGGSAGPSDGASPAPSGISNAQRDALVQDCVRTVLATLRMNERR